MAGVIDRVSQRIKIKSVPLVIPCTCSYVDHGESR